MSCCERYVFFKSQFKKKEIPKTMKKKNAVQGFGETEIKIFMLLPRELDVVFRLWLKC